jgi:hypothetical protein
MTWNRLLLAVMALVAAWLGHGIYQDARVDKGRLTVTQAGDAVVLTWAAGIDIPMVTRFTEAFDAWKGRTGHFVIRLHSPGGSLREGRELIELIRQVRRTHRVDTLVADGHVCASMCVPVYLQGESRYAGRRARFMFHQPARYDSQTDERIEGPAFEQRALARRFFERYFVNSPITPAWLEKLEKDWVGKDIWKTAEELSQENSGIVTDLR